jgi:hypothetical protein
MQVQSLGRYRIERELGRGAMGRVFLAYDPQIDRRVAIKTIQIFSALPESERLAAGERFLREARSAGKLLHSGIVTIFDVGESDGVPYLAMEYVEGETLDAFCREDDLLPVADVIALLAAAAEALGFAHERGIIHRDIKPANLMRVGQHAVKIMDFGLAKNPTSSMTHDGALLGTPNYMSPEQVRGEPLDGRSDLFSLGVVCFEMLTGMKPFEGDSISSVLYRIVNETPKEIPLHMDRVPTALAAFLTRALAKSPDDRFESGAQFAVALRRAGQIVSSAASKPQAGAAHPPAPVKPAPAAGTTAALAAKSGRKMGRWLAGIMLAILGAGAAAFIFFGKSSPPPIPQLSARVRTEPAGIPVRLDGAPVSGSEIAFSAGGPFGLLSASQGCRETTHRIDAADAGREVVLVLDPERADVSVDGGVPGAHITLNGQEAGTTPATIELDLCRDNTISVASDGYETAITSIAAKATPLDARNAAGGIRLAAIPTGRIVLPEVRYPVAYFIDGKPASREGDGITIAAGTHEVRMTNEERFVDASVAVTVQAGADVSAALSVPRLAELTVQTFPPNCVVAVKRPGGAWRQLGETPLRYDLASGRYEVRIEAPVSGESREQEIQLAPGRNAPLRVSFGRLSR